MRTTVGIVGAGLMGRILGLTLAQQGWAVSLFDQDPVTVSRSCAYAGAGMLSPISELETAEPIVAQLGFDSLPLWAKIVEALETPVFFQQAGTLIVAHHLDVSELDHVAGTLKHKLAQAQAQPFPVDAVEGIQWHVTRNAIRQLEPQLSDCFQQGLFLPHEGQIDNRQLLPALEIALNQWGVQWHMGQPVQSLAPHRLDTDAQRHGFDWVIDCRGLGAKADWSKLRGVRGEIIRVHAPEVTLNRPVRLMHPRYPLYIAPRENHHFVIGATSLESEDFRPMTVQSALELLSAAFTVHAGFAEASILESTVNCRPALPDHRPQIQTEPGLIRINGLYRHGFLMAPAIAQLVCDFLQANAFSNSVYQALFDNSASLSEKESREESRVYATTNQR